MSEEKPITKSDLVDVLGTFTDDVLLPAMNRMVDDKLDKNFENKIKPEIRKSEQRVMDYTDKRIGETEGKIIPRLNSLTETLYNKNVINKEDFRRVGRVVG